MTIFDIIVDFWNGLFTDLETALNSGGYTEILSSTITMFTQTYTITDVLVVMMSYISIFMIIYYTYKFIRFILSFFNFRFKKGVR